MSQQAQIGGRKKPQPSLLSVTTTGPQLLAQKTSMLNYSGESTGRSPSTSFSEPQFVSLPTEVYIGVCYCGHRAAGTLGSGEFGTVSRGVWLDGGRRVDVAIKKLKGEKQMLR